MRAFLVGGLLIGLVVGGCRSSPSPDKLFADAEDLRLRYEKDASRVAIIKYRAALEGWKRAHDRRNAARAGQQIGATYEQLGLLHESVKSYAEALALAKESGARLLESGIGSNLGTVLAFVADRNEAFVDARRRCEQALDLARQLSNPHTMASALNCLGEVAYYRQHLEEALEFYRQAESLWELIDEPKGRAQTLVYQGFVQSDLSRFDDALYSYDRARSLWALTGHKREQAILLVAEARLQARRGDYQEALNNFRRALSLLEPMGDLVWEGSGLTGIARIYLDLGETRAALKYWERALQLFETAGLNHISVDVLNSLGQTYLASGDDVNALSRFERALALAEKQRIQHFTARALDFIGVVHLFRHLPDQATREFRRSLDVQRSPGSPKDPRLEARTLVDLAEATDQLGAHDIAAGHFDEALALSREGTDRVTEARALFGLARASLGHGDLDAARNYVERSLRIAESLRTEVESRDLRASYFASVYQYHEFHMDLLMRLHRVRPGGGLAAAAFEASERARARSLLESLTAAGVDLRTGVDPDLLKREQRLKSAFDDWARRHRRLASAPTPNADLRALTDEYRDLEERYSQIQSEIRSKSPRYAALAQPQPLTLEGVQQQVLDAESLLLEYALGDERSYLWAVSNREYASYQLAPRAEIERSARRVYELLTTRLTVTGDLPDRSRRIEQADTEYWREATRLSEILLGPVATKMAGKRILVVTDGALQYLPFAALPVPGRREVPMVVEHEIISLPSASVLAALRRERRRRESPERAVAVLADPVFEADDPRLRAEAIAMASPSRSPLRDNVSSFGRLVATRQEADAIVAAAPGGMTLKAIDFDASRATAMSAELAHYRIVHFATHGVFDNDNPGLSGVILSMFDRRGQPQDGFLRLHDIYGLDLPADLVVLSACNTALGRPVRGEGLVGIVRGFMYAGARRVVASLWKVDDEATGEMMSRFYREMLREGRSPAASLRQAQLAMWRQDRRSAPFHWAAFVLQGEWQ